MARGADTVSSADPGASIPGKVWQPEKRLTPEVLGVRVYGNGREWRMEGAIPVHTLAAATWPVSITSECFDSPEWSRLARWRGFH